MPARVALTRWGGALELVVCEGVGKVRPELKLASEEFELAFPLVEAVSGQVRVLNLHEQEAKLRDPERDVDGAIGRSRRRQFG